MFLEKKFWKLNQAKENAEGTPSGFRYFSFDDRGDLNTVVVWIWDSGRSDVGN